ncbi:MAG: DUF2304 domain-containing protein [Bryobacteraceae bacterium]
MIRIILLTTLSLLFFYIGSHKRSSRFQFGFLVIFFISGGILVMQPDRANEIAASLGVGRGADLLLYFSVLAGIYITAAFYLRFHRNEQIVITIVRELALARPVQEVEPEANEQLPGEG